MGSQQQTDMLTGSGFQVELRGHDLDILQEQAKDVADLLADLDQALAVYESHL